MTAVTVLTVTYGDRWSTLQETLASVLDDPSSRVIVVSNGSRPPSAAQLDSFAAEHSERVRVVSFEKNLGSSPAFAAGLEVAYEYGDAILILDDDNPIPAGLIPKLREIEAATRAKLPAGRLFSLEVFRGVNSVHRAIAEGSSVDYLFREQRPGAFQGFDLPSLVSAKVRGRAVTHASNAARTLEVEADGENQTLVAIPNAMWGGLFLPEDVVSKKVLPETELILYGDDNDFSSRLGEEDIAIYLCLGVTIEDTLVWKVPQGLPGLRGKLPTTFQLPDSDAWRMQYLHRNQAYLSLLLVGAPAARLRFAFNVAARLVLLAGVGVVAGRPGYAWKLISASVSGLRRKLGPSYPLPR
jgi:glycosyltransferase involved in cell wall biosynthesis